MTRAVRAVRYRNNPNEKETTEYQRLADRLCRKFPGKENEMERLAIREAAEFLDATEYLLTKPTSASRAVGELVTLFIQRVTEENDKPEDSTGLGQLGT